MWCICGAKVYILLSPVWGHRTQTTRHLVALIFCESIIHVNIAFLYTKYVQYVFIKVSNISFKEKNEQ